MILTQTKAMFVDAFRELHARKLFWITMVLSLMIVALFALLGVEKGRGITFAVWTIPGSEDFAERVSPALFYRFFMLQFGINIWLSWAATIIALISTASIVPSLVTDGAIDTVLSKPIGRARLFLTKYVTGLLFVVLQVGVFALGCLIVIGLRAGVWEWGLLLSVPIITAFFSFLFCVSALLGFLTKSPLTSVLITGVFWIMLFMVNLADGVLMDLKHDYGYDADFAAAQVETQTDRIAELSRQIEAAVGAGEEPEPSDERQLQGAEERLEQYRNDATSNAAVAEDIAWWHGMVFGLKTVLPKTGETIALLERWLIDTEEIDRIFPGMLDASASARLDEDDDSEGPELKSPTRRVVEESRSRSMWWVLGTSFGFEFLVVGLTCLLFARRDF